LLKTFLEKNPSANLKESEIHFDLKDRWPIPADFALCPESEKEYTLNAAEVLDIAEFKPGEKSETQRNIELRDFRLIDQADCVLAYRPRYGRKDISQGMRAEIIYAKDVRAIPIPVVHVHRPEVDGELDDPLGPEMSYCCSSISEAIKLIGTLIEKG